ncbi:RES domain-containing protein [Priestia megaterium]|uniref:RES domain-containing protein n=1 Tax=Priestia megaterium TaxID=1404 RepID=A0A6H1P4G2_PRIMG|nr:RES domain-containing protein [Priestia megaterium]QIZ08449.1 RES domain-containing protein [Priestia megaterium]
MAKKNFESNVQLMTDQWINLKEDLHNGVVEFDDLSKLLNDYIFFKVFDDFFKETCKFFEVSLSDIKHMYRGVADKIDLSNYERMIPKVEFAKGNNRMNPPGKAFLYAGFLGKDIGKDENSIKKHAVKTVLKEIRATENSVATICKFQINESAKNKKVINICGDSSIPKSEAGLTEYIYKHAIIGFSVDREKLACILANVYFNMFSTDQIFKPINTNEQEVKKYEYAPFHAVANYMSEQGYAGMIFRSTVHQNGTNLVLFNPSDASVIQNSMEHINTSDYLF